MEVLWKLHRWVYKQTGGRLGGSLFGMPVLLLITTDRRTARPSTTALSYLEDHGRYIVIASNAGEPRHPAWFLNLQAYPTALVRRGSELVTVTAREAVGCERDRLWARVIAADAAYGEFQRRTARLIPVVVLAPRPQTCSAS